MTRKNGFTLIELITGLVILAIIALILVPIIGNLINKTKESAAKRSVDGYGRAVEQAIMTYYMEYGKYPTSISELTLEYTKADIKCLDEIINDDAIVYLSKCTVNGASVRDNTTDDLYYHYRTDQNRIYDEYEVGTEITYAGIEFYVLKGDKNDNYVTLLKKEPLSVYEVATYGVGHINRYTQESQNEVYQYDGYACIAFYSSENCGYVDGSLVTTGCITSYNNSDIKYVVDAWAEDKLVMEDLEEIEGYKTRLVRKVDMNNAGCGDDGFYSGCSSSHWLRKYPYWSMTYYSDTMFRRIDNFSSKYTFANSDMYGYNYVVRPVINLKKSALK